MSKTRSPFLQSRTEGGVGPLILSDPRFFGVGNVFFVQSINANAEDAAGHGQTPDAPLATIDYAIGLCTHDQGDMIIVLPGHAESIIAAGGITADIRGISIIGVGNGSLRPTITFATSTAATFAISADNVTVQNLRVKTSIDELVKMFVVTAAYCTLDNIEHVDNGATAQSLQFVNVSAAADYFTLKNCFHYQSVAAAAAQKWIELVGCDCARIIDNTFMILANAATASQLIAGTTAVVRCEIARNCMLWLGATVNTVVNLVTGSTGFIHDNRAFSGTSVATAAAFTGDACGFSENYWADSAVASGLLAPAIDTDT